MTLKEDLEPRSGQRAFGYAQWKKDWVKVSGELSQDRQAWELDPNRFIDCVG